MARERDRKRTTAAGDRRRAGTYLAQLGWLAGYPDEGGWRRLDDDAVMPLDGAAVAKARRTGRTVIREHREGLAKLVGDVDRWWASVDAKLAAISATIAGKAGDPLAALLPGFGIRLAAAIRALLPTPVGAAARAVAIAYAETPGELAELIDWIAKHQTLSIQGELPGWRVIVALAQLEVIGDRGKARAVRERGVDALIRLCELDAPDGTAALEANRNVENRLRRQHSSKQAPDPTRSLTRVVPWIVRLATRETTHRQRILAIVAEAKLAEALAPWQAWEREHEKLLERAKALAESKFESALEQGKHEAKLIIKIEKSRAAAPVEVSLKGVLLELDMLGGDYLARFHPSIVRLLAALPAAMGVAAPARMLLHVARAAATCDEEHLEWVWDALAAALEDGAPLELLAPWREVMTSDGRLYLESDMVEHAKRRGDVERLMRVLVGLAWQGKIDREDPTRAAMWIAAGLTDEGLVAEVVAATRDVDGWMLTEIARAALAIAERTATDLAAACKLLLETAEDWRHALTVALCTLLEHAAASGGAWIVRAALEAKQGAALAAIGETLKLTPRAKWPAMCRPPADATWIDRYPAALQPALHRLAAVDPDAERTAAKRLESDFPDPAAIREEMAALRERLDKPGTAKRLANLEARLTAPKARSQARLATLATKLERAAREIGLARFTQALTRGASERLCKAFGLAALPPWATAPKNVSILVALLSLDEWARELAGRLIRARCGERPWDLRDEPANRAFLDELRAARIDPAPWLDDRQVAITPKSGEPFTLGMTDDPIEVFAMGAHFETCLSPGGGNFFSTVANAADVNKRVIYAKRDGRVIGRCLLALTEGFAILTFHVYCHEAINLDDHVRDFVLDLAQRMGTTVEPRGAVRRLLARDWYDDGPRDLVGRFRGLDEAGLDFDTIDPAALVGVLTAALGRPIDDVTLPVVLNHGGFSRRPELVIPLAPFVIASVVPQTHVDAAELALRAGDRALADRLLGDHAAAVRIDDHGWHYGQVLAELRPSYTLARLRETRPRHVRDWDDERAERVALAGVALERLHRTKQAAAMYRLAMKYEDWLAPFMKVRLEGLGETVED